MPEPDKRSRTIVGGDDIDMDELLQMEREMSAADFEDVRGDEDEEEISIASAAVTAADEDDPALSGQANSRWHRPDVDPAFDPAVTSLAFQWTSIDLMSGDPLPVHPRGKGLSIPGASVGPVPIIRY